MQDSNQKTTRIGRFLFTSIHTNTFDPFGSRLVSIVAGMEGFEPPNVGTKNRCLTTWRHPINHTNCTLTGVCSQGRGLFLSVFWQDVGEVVADFEQEVQTNGHADGTKDNLDDEAEDTETQDGVEDNVNHFNQTDHK
jgi:hypothetical protein